MKMFRSTIVFCGLLLTAVRVQAQCARPNFGENRVMAEYTDQNNFEDDSVVRFKCATGYVTVNPAAFRQARCVGNKWEGLELRCTKKSCGHPGDIKNGKYFYPPKDGILFGSTITAKCNDGYQLVGQQIRNCRENGWDGRTPVCEVLKCKPPTNIAGGTFEPVDDAYEYGDVVTYSCYRNLHLIGQSEIMCSGDGTFKPEPPKCLDVSCNNPAIEKAFRIEGKSPPYKFNNFIRFKCAVGYKMEGSDFVICTENGWNPPLPRCNVITCLQPQNITKGQFDPLEDWYKYGQTVTYSCLEGFKLHGPPVLTCSATEKFEPAPPQCQEIICRKPNINFGFINETTILQSYNYNDKIKISCNTGFKIEGHGSLTCKENGWHPALPRCKRIFCTKPPSIQNGQFLPSKNRYEYGDSVTYHCKDGFTSKDQKTSTCTANEKFEPGPPKCQKVTCVKPNINNAVIEDITSQSNAMSIRVTCNTGYTIEGHDVLTCNNNAWNRSPPTCKIRTCKKPPETDNIAFVKDEYDYGENVTYVCEEGLKIYGESTVSCSEDGKFHLSPSPCLEIICDAPNIDNAVIVKGQAPYRKQTSVQYQCSKGYKMEGFDTLTCAENGEWDPAPPKCKIVTCSKPKFENGEFYPVKEEYEYGQTIKYICKKGFQMEGDSAASCSDNGIFQHSPQCARIHHLQGAKL